MAIKPALISQILILRKIIFAPNAISLSFLSMLRMKMMGRMRARTVRARVNGTATESFGVVYANGLHCSPFFVESEKA